MGCTRSRWICGECKFFFFLLICTYFKARKYTNVSVSGLYRFAKNRPGANPCHFRTLKHFAEFVGLSIPGQLEEMPTVDTVRCYMRRFTSIWPRETGEHIPEQFRRSLTHVSVIFCDSLLYYPITAISILTGESISKDRLR
jgi:hypothetical protein